MSLLCYNKGCGQMFLSDQNNKDSCLFHPGVPIFHDALKGWSCCKKRTTDFSEFLSIQGCTRGLHSDVKPQEPLRPEVTSDKTDLKHNNGIEIIYQGPKSAETLQRERPSPSELKVKLPQKVSVSLSQALEKLQISKKAEEVKENQTVMIGTRCKNSSCKTVYEGPETDSTVCLHHPGGPVFHEGYKYWSCCCIKTIDFNAFLDQKGCSAGKHRWLPKQDKKKVSCRYDWHQTGKNVVVTIYAKNANPEFSYAEANGTVLSCQIQFENDKIFKRDFHLWGVVNVPQSSVNLVPSKVEVSLRKADPVSWGKLEDPNYKPPPEPADNSMAETGEAFPPSWDIEDDDISDSDEEWAYDTAENKRAETEEEEEKKEMVEKVQRKEVEQEIQRAMEERRREEEAQKEREEQRRQDEEEGYEDMPDLE